MEPKHTYIHNNSPRLANWKTKVFNRYFLRYTEGNLNNTKTWHWLKRNSFKKKTEDMLPKKKHKCHQGKTENITLANKC